LPKLNPAKPAKGDCCWWEVVGERVSVGEAEGVAVLLLLLSLSVRGEGEVGEVVGLMDGFEGEKAVWSFWRERDGERRVEGMVWYWSRVLSRTI
jgi:hypothetical protein